MKTFEMRYRLESEDYTGQRFFKHVEANSEQDAIQIIRDVNSMDHAFDIYAQEVPASQTIERFENETGLTFDPNGPSVIECEYCGSLLQYIVDHDCHGLRCASVEAYRVDDY